MRLLVTGGAGFIGSNYARWALGHSDDAVTVYDALTYAGNPANIRDLEGDPRFTFVKGDVCDRAALEEAMRGHEAVVHFAAESHVDRSIVSPDDFVRTNCGGTNVVMDVARRVGVERVVHISTDEVYGSVPVGSSAETDPLDPRSPYSVSKAGSDLIALSYVSTYGLPVVVTRSSNNFGPYQHPEKVIPLFVTNLLEGQKVPLYGDGQNIRDWCYVEDNCAALDLVLRRGAVGEIYNIGAGNELPNVELTQRILALLGHDETMIEPVADRLGHDRRYSIDTAKVRALGWQPGRELDEALAATVEWVSGQPPVVGAVAVKVLVTGAGGQVGRATVAHCEAAGDEVLGVDRARLDITDRDAVLGAVTSWRPDAVINPAAYTDVDGCERDPDRAWAANTLAVRHLADACHRAGAHLLHVSTDYVFDGRKRSPYHEWDDTSPLGVYARSKLAGEREAGPEATVVRTSWVYGRHGGNFVQAVLDRAASGQPLRFIDDQTGTPTNAEDLAELLRRLAVNRVPGLFHGTNGGEVTRFQQAREIVAAAGWDPEQVAPMKSAELPWVAPRPAYTVLDNAALRLSGMPLLPHYRGSMASLVKELVG